MTWRRIWIPQLVVIPILLWGLTLGEPNTYYTYAKWFCCAAFLYLSGRCSFGRRPIWSLIWFIVAVVYCPLFNIRLVEENWYYVNISVLVITVISLLIGMGYIENREQNILSKMISIGQLLPSLPILKYYSYYQGIDRKGILEYSISADGTDFYMECQTHTKVMWDDLTNRKYLLIDDEIIECKVLLADSNQLHCVEVVRGKLDTQPKKHTEGATVYPIDNILEELTLIGEIEVEKEPIYNVISIIHDDTKETIHQAVNEASVRKFGVKPGYVSQIIDEEFSELHANVITEGFFNRYSVERIRLIIPTQDSIRRVKAPQENDNLMFFVNISTIYVTGVNGAPDGCYLIEWGPTERNTFIRCVQMKI